MWDNVYTLGKERSSRCPEFCLCSSCSSFSFTCVNFAVIGDNHRNGEHTMFEDYLALSAGDWRRLENWLGCTTDADFYNGSCAYRAIRAPHDKTLLEIEGCCAESLLPQLVNSHNDWMDNKIKWENKNAIWSMKKPYLLWNERRPGVSY